MDAVIRSAVIAPFRTRLSEAQTTHSAQPSSEEARLEAIKDEIGKQIRGQLMAQAQEIYDQQRERGHADGHAAGLAEARAAAAKQHQQLRETLDSTLSALEQAQRTHLSRLESSVGEIAFAAICQMAGHKAVAQSFALGIVERTCAQLRASAVATVRMHPRAIELLRPHMHGDELRMYALVLKVVPDESLQPGGCLMEADCGVYDGGIETQLRRLHAVLIGNETGSEG